MSIELLPRSAFYCYLIALLSLAFWPESAATEDVLAAVPTNAHAKRYGGWECDRGYRKDGRACVGIEVPLNGYLDSSGRDWSCERGFKQRPESCDAIQVPAHAHLAYAGSSWRCDPGYRREGKACSRDKQ
jgi:hypothetical protein